MFSLVAFFFKYYLISKKTGNNGIKLVFWSINATNINYFEILTPALGMKHNTNYSNALLYCFPFTQMRKIYMQLFFALTEDAVFLSCQAGFLFVAQFSRTFNL